MNNSIDPYQLFAAVYDLPAHGEIGDAFYRAAQPVLNELPPRSAVLDVGCGTGKITELLATDGFHVVGIDNSEAMLQVARQRCRSFGSRVQFLCEDLTSFKPDRNWPLALACGEIVNHFALLETAQCVFQRLSDCLTKDGRFVFETLNRFCFEEYWDDSTYFYPSENGDVVMECSWDSQSRQGTAHIVSFEKRSDHYVKSETTLYEYWHDEDAIRQALLDNGFGEVLAKPWTPWGSEVDDEKMDRTFWQARK